MEGIVDRSEYITLFAFVRENFAAKMTLWCSVKLCKLTPFCLYLNRNGVNANKTIIIRYQYTILCFVNKLKQEVLWNAIIQNL